MMDPKQGVKQNRERRGFLVQVKTIARQLGPSPGYEENREKNANES
jgi:hypothetical protein